MVSLPAVQKEEGQFGACLIQIIEDTDVASTMLEECGGDGLKLLSNLRSISKGATGKDRSLVVSTVNRLLASGFPGQVNLSSFNNHFKKFNKENRMLAKDDRKTEDDIIQMIHAVMYRSVSVCTQNMYTLGVFSFGGSESSP